MILPIIIVAGVLLVGGAAGVHAMQLAREKLAQRRQRAADARAAERAEREAAAAAEDMRRSRNPQHYITVQRSRIRMLLAPLRERLRQRNAEMDQLQTELADAAPDSSLRRRLLAGAFLVLLVVLFVLSISGPPGVGKTMLRKAAARELGLPLAYADARLKGGIVGPNIRADRLVLTPDDLRLLIRHLAAARDEAAELNGLEAVYVVDNPYDLPWIARQIAGGPRPPLPGYLADVIGTDGLPDRTRIAAKLNAAGVHDAR